MINNLYSLGLLRNGKVYQTKELAIQGLTQTATNDGVAKLARYLYQPIDGDKIIRTVVGFYANAAEMEDAGGGNSYYTILDVEGSAADIQELREAIEAINAKIGAGIDGKTLTQAINEANAAIDQEVADRIEAIDSLSAALTKVLTISLETAETPTEGYLKTYILSQGINDAKREVGRIDIPKDMVVSGGSLVHGTWVDEDTFIEDPDGPDTAIKIEFANADIIYLNTKDLVDFYTSGDGITVDNTANTISIKINNHTEEFLVLDSNGLKVEGIHAAIDNAVEAAKLSAGDGISINANKVTAVAASFSKEGIKNPIIVDKNGIKFSSTLDCGFFDSNVVIARDAEAIDGIENPSDTDVFIASEEAVESLVNGNDKTFKSIAIGDAALDTTVELKAVKSIEVDGLAVAGGKDGKINGKILYTAPIVSVKNVDVANGSTVYNVFEGTQYGTPTNVFMASDITVDNPSLKHNVFNIYKVNDDAVIDIKDSYFNLNVNNSNILRLSNNIDATGVTVNFENIDWTYENTPNKEVADWACAGLIIYQPWLSTDSGFNGDLSVMKTWKFNFINCKYNGVKVNANNFGEKNQVFYMYNIGNDGNISDPVGSGLKLTFK